MKFSHQFFFFPSKYSPSKFESKEADNSVATHRLGFQDIFLISYVTKNESANLTFCEMDVRVVVLLIVVCMEEFKVDFAS